ncbi:MAG TPA: glycosyltransferase family 39 protein [Candidatus Dormibacteraeota bacterium]|nr:glycosyltransferase family 39 protein [Candidatus Dormibacteraeota bacterium]
MSTTDPSVSLPARTRADHASAVPWLPVVGLAAVKVAVSMVFAGRYGWHRDELYYLASARHPALGYVDYPPVAPMIARLVQVVAPDSVVALKFASVLAGAVVVVLAALIARELGGGRRAQVLAALAVVISPLFLGGNFIFETVSFDQVVWALLLWLVARVLAGGDRRLWLLAGLVLGIGLETKYTVIGLAVALAAGLLLTPARRHLATRWPWLGAALAVVLLVPNLWWQAGHGWDSVAYTLHHRGATDGPVAYWLQQALVLVQPLLLPLVVAGAVWLWRSGTFRALAWTGILVELLFFLAGGKSYYPAPVYPLLYAAGAVWLERSVGSRLLRRAWATATAVAGLVLLPVLLPVLPADVMARSGALTSVTADMYGWPDLAHQVAAAYASLPPSDRQGAMVLASNYGEAGVLDLYGPGLGLPPVVSPHLTYYYWAPARMSPDVVIAVGYQRQDLEPLFADVTRVGTISNSYGVDNHEAGMPIFVCRSPRRPLWQAWPSLKRLD